MQLERALKIVEAGGPCEICGLPPAVAVVGSENTDGSPTCAIALCATCAAREAELVRERIL
jgi:hypothetical protein